MGAHMQRVKQLFTLIDDDKSGHITIGELEHRISDSEVQAYFESLEIDVNDVWSFFKLLDKDGTKSVEAEEFLDGCVRLRGNAKALDVAKLMHDEKQMRRKLNFFIQRTNANFDKMLAILEQTLIQCNDPLWS